MNTQTLSQSILKYFMMLIFILFMNTVSAVGEFGGGDDDPDASGPVDGGLTFLLIAGAAYGARKLHQYKNKTTE